MNTNNSSKLDMEDILDLLKHVHRLPHGDSLPSIRERIAQRSILMPRRYLLVAATLLLLMLSTEVLMAAKQRAKYRTDAMRHLVPVHQTWSYDE